MKGKTKSLGNGPRTLGPNPWEKEKSGGDDELAQALDPDRLIIHTPEASFPDLAVERSKHLKKIVSNRDTPVQPFSHVWGKNDKTSGRGLGTKRGTCSHR
jgi:hypothetical protein